MKGARVLKRGSQCSVKVGRVADAVRDCVYRGANFNTNHWHCPIKVQREQLKVSDEGRKQPKIFVHGLEFKIN